MACRLRAASLTGIHTLTVALAAALVRGVSQDQPCSRESTDCRALCSCSRFLCIPTGELRRAAAKVRHPRSPKLSSGRPKSPKTFALVNSQSGRRSGRRSVGGPAWRARARPDRVASTRRLPNHVTHIRSKIERLEGQKHTNFRAARGRRVRFEGALGLLPLVRSQPIKHCTIAQKFPRWRADELQEP